MKSKLFNQAVKRMQRAFTKNDCISETIHALKSKGNIRVATEVEKHFADNPTSHVIDRHRASEMLSRALFSQDYNITANILKAQSTEHYIDNVDISSMHNQNGIFEKLKDMTYSLTPQAKELSAQHIKYFMLMAKDKSAGSTLLIKHDDDLIGRLKTKADFWKMVHVIMSNSKNIGLSLTGCQYDVSKIENVKSYEVEMEFHLDDDASISLSWEMRVNEYGDDYDNISILVNGDESYEFCDEDGFQSDGINEDVSSWIREHVNANLDRDICIIDESKQERIKVLYDEMVSVAHGV